MTSELYEPNFSTVKTEVLLPPASFTISSAFPYAVRKPSLSTARPSPLSVRANISPPIAVKSESADCSASFSGRLSTVSFSVEATIRAASSYTRKSFSSVSSPANAALRMSLPNIAYISFESAASTSQRSAYVDLSDEGVISLKAI